MAQTEGLVTKNISFLFQLDPSLCGTVRAVSRTVLQLWRTALDPRCILDLLVDISATVEQCISVIAPARVFVLATQRFKNKEEISSCS